ncbi:integrase catalytic domain-containing protein [Trichonephila clavipes]|uniref:Integrase catalytic domain-containing protein n=1 Tax=Trichonephila clavipes TaxID=2585209 RepID=A0A8X6R1K5_TRICX|nr:integrase catalytic domain-containing protein [Trichonephila clavipes]
MFSDNATNFKGASSYLKEQLKLIKSVEVQNFVTQESITWHFIPPTAAHIGGLWEAGIKSTKQLLIKTMKSAVLNFEELVTLVTQIEACLNSRPLTPLSNDPQDLQPLTPGHFLIGAPMASFPEEVPSQPACLKKRWNLIQHLRSQFWRRWHLEYLNQLQQRTKWNKPRRNLKVNDMVLVKEDNLPPLQWSLGRVVQVFPGDDGAVRVVDVKTQRGQFRRPITKCCLLPTEDWTDSPGGGVCLQLPSTEGATTKTLKNMYLFSVTPFFRRIETATAGSDVVQSGRPIFDDFFQHLWPYIGNNTANVVFQMVKRLWLIRIDQ